MFACELMKYLYEEQYQKPVETFEILKTIYGIKEDMQNYI